MASQTAEPSAGGLLTISARNLEVDEGSRADPAEGRYVRLAVIDTATAWRSRR